MNSYRVLSINPGATSTKIAVFDDEQVVYKETIEHHGDQLKAFQKIVDQFDYRLELILQKLQENSIAILSLDAVVGRGGLLKPLAGGTYLVNDSLKEDLKAAARGEHASNLGALLADSIARTIGKNAYIVDPVSVDELEPEARLSGHPELPRISMSHALNSKAVARRAALEMNATYASVNLVTAHLGTGVTVTAHQNGRMIDVNNAQEEGPFSPDRTGGLPARALAKLCFSGKYSEKEMMKKISGEGGMFAYLGTRDAREVEKAAQAGDEKSAMVLKAMAYQVAKEIGAMTAVLCGKVDRIVLTGGLAHSKHLTDLISERILFIAPIVIYPGEEELESLAQGALRILRGQEEAQTY